MSPRECAIKLMRRCNSNNPFTIARALDVILIYCTLIDLNGFYQYHKRNHIIYLSEDLDEFTNTTSAIISSISLRTWMRIPHVLSSRTNSVICRCTET